MKADESAYCADLSVASVFMVKNSISNKLDRRWVLI
jgi:hypothetical protein